MQTLEPILGEHPVLRRASAASTSRSIAGCATNVRFDAGEFLVPRGRGGRQLLPHPPGARRARDPRARPRRADHRRPSSEGDVARLVVAGPAAPLALRRPRARPTTRAIALDGRCLRGKCEADPELGYELMKRFCGSSSQRLEATRLQLLDVYGDDGCRAAATEARPAAAPPDPMRPRPVARRAHARARRTTPSRSTLEPRRTAPRVRVRARAVQHAVRVRRRRGADLDQRRPGHDRASSSTPSAPSAPVTAAAAAAQAAATCSACAARTARRGRSTRREGSDVVLVAGGIGLAPLRPAHLPRARATASATARVGAAVRRPHAPTTSSSRRSSSAGAAASTSRCR